jgi:hypothetical protein
MTTSRAVHGARSTTLLPSRLRSVIEGARGVLTGRDDD